MRPTTATCWRKCVAAEIQRWKHANGLRQSVPPYGGLRCTHLRLSVQREWRSATRASDRYLRKLQDLRYGENPHQQAAFYRKPLAAQDTLTTAEQLHGKELSYNNINDANAALQIVKEFEEPAVVAVKHMNPCGVGIGESIYEAYSKAYAADPTSIFGGIVAANRIIDSDTANKLSEIFLEIVLAPDFTQEALDILTKRKHSFAQNG